jgi:nucleotide-binding universal stress UspA family protein
MKKILVALDLTPASESVLPYVAALLAREPASVALAHVLPPGRSANADRTGDALERLARRPELKHAHVGTLLLSGDPADEIAKIAGGFNLVALCSRGKSGLRRLLLGSTAEAIMRRASVPLLVVHPLKEGARPAPVRRILVPLDGSRRAGTALAPAVALARAWKAGLVLLTVTGTEEERPAIPVRLALENLSKTARKLRAEGLRVEVAARPGDPSLEILQFAADNAVDLIAISTHGRTGVSRLAYGSVAERVLRKSTFPLLVVRTAGVPRAHRAHARAAERAVRAGRETRRMQDIGAGPYRG